MPTQTIDLLLLNLGTPQAANLSAVRRYLREFLSDPRVIDVPSLLRWLLLYGVFLPFRSKQTTQAYQQIWQQDGSPLLIHSQQLQQSLAKQLGNDYRVTLAMRYGKPSIEQAITEITTKQDCKRLIILPLYPQYSSAATGTVVAKTLQLLSHCNNIPNINVITSFYNHPLFIQAYASIILDTLASTPFDQLIFSYHGLPERHIDKSGCQFQHCDRKVACPKLTSSNHYCYRSQCFTTSHLLAKALQLDASQYQVAFQSRLGKLPWISPYTDQVLPELFQQGVRDLAVVCPSFTCDCLETLEEMGIRAKKQWLQLGGRSFRLIPCLNTHPQWLTALTSLILNEREYHKNY